MVECRGRVGKSITFLIVKRKVSDEGVEKTQHVVLQLEWEKKILNYRYFLYLKRILHRWNSNIEEPNAPY